MILVWVISPEFFPQIDWIFVGEALNPFFGAPDEGFLEFSFNFILVFDAKQVYLKASSDQTLNPKTLEKTGFLKTLNP